MPYVNVKLARATGSTGATTETKAQIIKGITQVLVDVLRMDPQVVSVTIEEVDTDNWGKGGETLTVRLKKAK